MYGGFWYIALAQEGIRRRTLLPPSVGEHFLDFGLTSGFSWLGLPEGAQNLGFFLRAFTPCSAGFYA